MNKRITKPEYGNKFYNTRSNGGYSQCIQGSPTDHDADVLANCVGYACGRFNEIIGTMNYPALNCNAENFIERAISLGLKIVSRPTLGGICVAQKGATLKGSDGAGHVWIPEELYEDGSHLSSESGYGSKAFWTAKRSNANGKWGLGAGYTFRGCIVNPAIGEVYNPEPKPVDPFPGVSDEELANRVWLGVFGNGDARKNTLGIRYSAVQALVDQGIGKPKPEPIPEPIIDILDLTRRTIRGDFGNGNARRAALGSNYDEVQKQLNLNYANGKTRWNNIRLY
jgi:surface antigen